MDFRYAGDNNNSVFLQILCQLPPREIYSKALVVTLKYQVLEKVSCFPYLGSHVSSSDDIDDVDVGA